MLANVMGDIPYSKVVLYVYIGYLVLMSFVALFLFIKDKNIAKKNNSGVRIKEKTLLASVVFGGAIGGFIGRIIARHKTNKSYFSFTIYLSLLLQIAILVLFVLLAFSII